ncbi:glycosyltransferase family 4 protein [Streptomyces sp. PU-14G]|uniref:glycosyltransferase family 4 protein n=1 Tax=Streptomyces sp. PU-14G TaxID=2800808 RepID=UPI0034DE4A0B
MRIAHVAPLGFRVPPTHYGAAQRFISYLVEQQVRDGHEVTLFACSGSSTSANLVECADGEVPVTNWQRHMVEHIRMYEEVYRREDQFDIIHNNTQMFIGPLARRSRTPTVTTIHHAPEIPGINVWPTKLLEHYAELPLVAVSTSQRRLRPDLNWQAVIHHGLPQNAYDFCPEPEEYLVHIGRADSEKGLPDAVRIAKASGLKLKVAAYANPKSPEYWDSLQQYLKDPGVEFVGEVGDREKQDLIGHAKALLFPIQWEEPFGIVLIEALACGTPVIAYRRGAVPEIIKDGVNGWLVSNIDEAAAAVGTIDSVDRINCRRSFEERFTAQRMASDYEHAYEQILKQSS